MMRRNTISMNRLLPWIGITGIAAVLVIAPAASAKRRNKRGSRAPVHKIDACQILTPKLAQLAGAPANITPRPPSKYGFAPHPRCTYEWEVADRKAKELAYVEAIQKHTHERAARMQRGEKRLPAPRPPVLNNHIGMSWLPREASDAAASASHAQALAVLQKGITARVDVKNGRAKVRVDKELMNDPKQKARAREMEKQAERSLVPAGRQLGDRRIEHTIIAAHVAVPDVGDEAAWVPMSGALLVRHGAQRFTIEAQVAPFSRVTQAGYRMQSDPNFIAAKNVALALVKKAP